MLHKHLTPSQSAAILRVYAAMSTQDQTVLGPLFKEQGPIFFRTVAAAYVHESLEAFEKHLGIPARSGKAVLSLCASILEVQLKDAVYG